MQTNSLQDVLSWQDPHTAATLTWLSDQVQSSDGAEYPVLDGIARFVASSQYAAAFGEQWKRYRQTQLDSYTGLTVTETRLRRCLGEDVWHSLQGKLVLEVGCGAGRFTELLLKQGARVVSVDLSEAVTANKDNCPLSEDHCIIQADVRQLPLAERQFDIVLCLGVVQHTPSPEETLENLALQVRQGGRLVIDHYVRNLSHYTKPAALLLRPMCKRLPAVVRGRAVEALVHLWFPAHLFVGRKYPWAHKFLSRLSPLICYVASCPELADDLQKEWALLDTHDNLTDWYKHFRTPEQIRVCLERLGFQDIRSDFAGNGLEASGQHPAGV